MQQSVKVVALCGSLRKASLNRRLIAVAQATAPAGMAIDIAEIRDLPLYDEDIEKAGLPAPVERLRGQIAGADALLFACPEYPRARRAPRSPASPTPSWGRAAGWGRRAPSITCARSAAPST